MHRPRRILLLAGAFLLHGCGARPSAILPHEVRIPLQESPGHHAVDGPLITAQANDTTWLFKVDTGANTCFLFNARDGHPWPLRRYRIPRAAEGWGGFQMVTHYAVVDRLGLGEAVLRDLRIPNGTSENGAEFGFLGMDVLGRWATLFDVDRAELRLLAPGDVGPRLSALYPGRHWTRLPLLGSPDRPEVELAASQGGRIRFLIDTGFNESAVTPQTARRLGLHPWEKTTFVSRDGKKMKVTISSGGAGVGGRFQAPRYILEGLHLGDRVCSPVVLQHAIGDVLGYDHLGVTPFVVDSPGRALWIADLPEGCRSESQVWAGRLAHPSRTLRDRAFRVLDELGDGFPVPEVASLLEQPDPTLRARAVALLRRWEARDLFPRIAALIRDPDPGVRQASLQTLDADAQVDASLILPILEDEDARVRQAAGDLLGRLRDPAVLPGLLARLDSPDTGTRLAALRALGCYADKALVSRFERLLGDPVPDIRAFAAEALGRSGGDPFLAGALAPLLEDPDPNVQMQAAEALWSLLGEPWEIPGYTVLKQGPDGISRFAKAEARYLEPARSWWRQHKDDPAYATGKSP